jgi:hypothetical protein
MARRRQTPEQVIRKLREAGWLLGEGADVAARGPASGDLRADVSLVASPVRRD